MSEQERLLKPVPPPEGVPPQYPLMSITPTAGGILIDIMHSSFHKEQFLIPVQASDQAAIEWLARRPVEVAQLITAVRHKLQAEQMLIQDIRRGNKNGRPGHV